MLSSPEKHERPKYKVHWHVIVTHFPSGAFVGAFLFVTLNVTTRNACYAQSAYVCLVAGLAMLIASAATGLGTWKRQYKGHRDKLFITKIWTAFIMIPVSAALITYQALHPFAVLDIVHSVSHFLYFVGPTALIAGTVTEGYWGGQLHHH